MSIKRKKQEIMVAFALVVAIIIVNLQGKVLAADTTTTTTTVAHFAVLKRGYERPTVTKSEQTAKYTKVGDGKIYETVQIDEDDEAVANNIAIEPDCSSILEENEKVVWYVCKKEADGWHVDGEIVTITEDETDVSESETESSNENETDTSNSESESSKENETEVTDTSKDTSSDNENDTTKEETSQEQESKTSEDTSNDTSNKDQEATTEESTEVKTTTTAHFAILKSGYTRPTTTKSEQTAKYIKVGDGKIYDTTTIDNNDKAVELNIAIEPDLSSYIEEDETVIWYVCKKEVDGWHIDGEVVKKEVNEEFANIYYEMLTYGETKTIDISEYELNYSDIKETLSYINNNKGYPLYWIFDDFDFEITQKNGKMETFKIKNVPENYETKIEEIVSKLDEMLFGRKLNDMETVEFIKNVLQK